LCLWTKGTVVVVFITIVTSNILPSTTTVSQSSHLQACQQGLPTANQRRAVATSFQEETYLKYGNADIVVPLLQEDQQIPRSETQLQGGSSNIPFLQQHQHNPESAYISYDQAAVTPSDPIFSTYEYAHDDIPGCVETVDQDHVLLSAPSPVLTEASRSVVAQDDAAMFSSPSTRLTSLDDWDIDGLGTLTTSIRETFLPSQFVTDSFRQCEELSFGCDQCQEVFQRRGELSKHNNRIHNRRYKCLYEGCLQKPFGLKADLQRHITAIHSTEKVAIQCLVDSCIEEFSRKDNMLRHVKNKHPGNEPSR
ncbi:hypothetical protein GT037_000099, partial [Alternaria burnsii]